VNDHLCDGIDSEVVPAFVPDLISVLYPQQPPEPVGARIVRPLDRQEEASWHQ
jgi:hypothetical protein